MREFVPIHFGHPIIDEDCVEAVEGRKSQTPSDVDVVKHKIGECYASAASAKAAVVRAYERHIAVD
jgi:hypothetical protein